jgi:hypothetical protein
VRDCAWHHFIKYLTSSFFSLSSGLQPSVHTMPTQFHGRTSEFTDHLMPKGMFRNHSLNTTVDKSTAHHSKDGLI